MAKKGSKKKKGGKRRRMGTTLSAQSPVVKILAVGAGFFVGETVNGAIDKVLPKQAGEVGPGLPGGTISKGTNTAAIVGQVGLGGLLLMGKKGGTVGLVKTVAGGVLAGSGLRRALKQMGVIKGYQAVPVIGRRRMAGYQNTPVLGATNNGTPAQLQGVPDQLQGFRVNGGLGFNGYGSQGSGVMGSTGRGSGISTGSDYMS
jgi:hypothetical protein